MSKSRRRTPRLGPNDGLHPRDLRELNIEFYRMRPWAYFQRQIELLALMSDRSDDLDRMLREGVFMGRAELRLAEDERVQDGEREKDRERFLIAQTEVVLHHAAETLLRFYFAHESLSPCPWLDIAANRDFRRFKRDVRGLADDLNSRRGRRDLMRVFLATNDRTAITSDPELTQEMWDASERNVSAWLGWFASFFLDANVYNAAKHGFALNAEDSSIEVGTRGDLDPLRREGPALLYIEETRGDDGPQWQRTIKWVSFETNARAVFMACRLLMAIVAVGAEHRGVTRLRTLQRLDRPELDDVLNVDMPRSGITFNTASIGMVYLRNRRPTAKRQR